MSRVSNGPLEILSHNVFTNFDRLILLLEGNKGKVTFEN
jgi:hypothetical protein